ncbi:MAG: SH3 domain-containing protein [Proteobacteria bacterium]|nr:SH3 domain-containing protein [Pseudomonadota bacterium]
MKLPGQCFLRYCRGLALCGVLLAAWAPVALAEFRSVADHAVVLYDAPSLKAKKLHILGRNYPVEIVVTLEGWAKVRDAGGELAWIETKSLSERRSVMVKVSLADVRQATDDKAPLAFQAEQNVLLDLVELTGTGWARVAHRDGQSGYIKLNVVWGV